MSSARVVIQLSFKQNAGAEFKMSRDMTDAFAKASSDERFGRVAAI